MIGEGLCEHASRVLYIGLRLVLVPRESVRGTELGRNPVSKYHIQPEFGDEQADAGRDCQTHLARSNSQARTWTGKYDFSLFS